MNTRRIGLFAAWLAGTILAVALASQAVALVRDQVTDRPSRATVPTRTDSSNEPATSLPTFTPTTQAGTSTSTTTTATKTTTTTTTTQASQVTSTTTTRDERYDLEGGWVKVACNGDRIVFKSAVPGAGYQVVQHDVSESAVEITFESEEHTSAFHATCEHGAIAASIDDEHGDHDGDD